MPIEKESFAEAICRLEYSIPTWKISSESRNFWKRGLEARGIQADDLRKAVDRIVEIPGLKSLNFGDLYKACRETLRERLEAEHRNRKDAPGADVFAHGMRSRSPYIRAVAAANKDLLSGAITRSVWEQKVKEANKLRAKE